MSRMLYKFKLRRAAFAAMAVAVGAVAAIPAYMGHVSAAPVTARSIRMSTSAISTAATYEIDFDVATAGAVQGVVVDFCTTPLLGTTCTKPTGLSIGAGTTTGTIAGMTGTWSGTQANTNRTLVLSLGTPGGTASAGASAVFTLTTATNPSGLGTFYARIMTFATAAAATAQAAANSGDGTSLTGVVDSGGVAMSTADVLTVTAKIQETLTFCIYTGANCAAAGTAVALGDGNGVLSSNVIDYENSSAKFDLASNAQSGVIVRMKGDTLKTGSFSISPHGTACTADSTTATVEQFGMRLSTVGSGQTATAPYNCAANLHGFDISSTCTNNDDNVTCTYGDRIASTAGATASSTSTLEFSAKSANSTEAGIYTANLAFIATGTY